MRLSGKCLVAAHRSWVSHRRLNFHASNQHDIRYRRIQVVKAVTAKLQAAYRSLQTQAEGEQALEGGLAATLPAAEEARLDTEFQAAKARLPALKDREQFLQLKADPEFRKQLVLMGILTEEE